MSDGLKLLGAIIDTGSIHLLRGLQEDYFLEDETPVYDFMRKHYRRYGNVPTISTVQEHCGVEFPDAEESVDYYARRVEDRYLYQYIKNDFGKLKTALRDYNMDAAREVIGSLRHNARVFNTASDVVSLGAAVKMVLTEYEDAHLNPGISGVPSGLPGLDHRTGGYQAGDLVTYVARPASGKTYAILSQSRHAWSKSYSVLIVTMEMTVPQITRRLLAMQAGINPDYIRLGQLSNAAKRRIQYAADEFRSTERLHLYSGGKKKRPSDVEILIQEYRPDIVFVDGVHLMNPDDTRAIQRNDRVSSLMDSMNQLTIDHKIPVVCTTHLNRAAGSKGKAASLETVAYSDAIGTHSSLVLSVSDGRGAHQKDQRVLAFLKGREGEFGEVTMNFKFRPMNFEEVPNAPEGGGSPVVTTGSSESSTDWMSA